MTHPVLPVYIINLDTRPDRWESIKKMCLACGIQPTRVSAVKESPGWIGCGKSHVKVAELAESNGEPWYLVMEDDASLMQDDWKRCLSLLPMLWNLRNQWDIFNGGPGGGNVEKVLSYDPLIFNQQGSLTHYLIVNSNAYPKIKSWAPEKGHVDMYFAGNVAMMATYPFISSQIESVSDIGNGNAQNDFTSTQERIKTQLITMKLVEGLSAFNWPSQRGRLG